MCSVVCSVVLRLVRGMIAFALVVAAVGCSIGPDPDFPPPIEPLAPEARAKIAVAPVLNVSPSAEVAQWSYATRRYLMALLERTRRFEVVPEGTLGAPLLEVRFTDVKDEIYLESVVFAGEQRTGQKRRAMVALEWSVVGDSRPASQLVSDELFESPEPLELPTPDQLESGVFWESPFGVATRENLDHLVREVCDRIGAR